ncbi:MAG: DUF1836 domain-containing protein [Caldicoprobacterales bacterium]|jgi:hypothetical protein|nr:DUF1836 domain-containing protein [Clostridiales bacterium]
MVQNLLTQLSELIVNSEDIRLDEIPEYRLYISQLEEFFDKKLGKGNGDDEERKVISKTMIQNYIKDGLLMSPEGKSYNRNHAILLILIYSLKSILSIRDIRRLLSPVISDVNSEDNSTEIEDIYKNFYLLKQQTKQELISALEDLADRVGELTVPENKNAEEEHQLRLLLFICTLITEANFRKRIAEFLIEQYFESDE